MAGTRNRRARTGLPCAPRRRRGRDVEGGRLGTQSGPARSGLVGRIRELVTNRALWHARGRLSALHAPRTRRNPRSRKSRGSLTRRIGPSECHRAQFVTNLRSAPRRAAPPVTPASAAIRRRGHATRVQLGFMRVQLGFARVQRGLARAQHPDSPPASARPRPAAANDARLAMSAQPASAPSASGKARATQPPQGAPATPQPPPAQRGLPRCPSRACPEERHPSSRVPGAACRTPHG